jgi:DNA polymerase I-like protein with 3'-5' exonuclease and polymerase domains
LSKYDGGRYVNLLLNDDIHQVNADAMGISRRAVKGVTYAFLYGAGNQKLGETFDDTLKPAKAKSTGLEIRTKFVDAIPGLRQLITDIKRAAARGYIKSIDGRRIALESDHVALNYLLQSGAGVIAKRWMVINYQNTKQYARQLAFIHDELQLECADKHSADLCTSLVSSSQSAGEYYNLRCPITADAKVGSNWDAVH